MVAVRSREREMIANHEVRLAFSSDAAGIAELSRSAIETGLPWSWTPRRVAGSIADPATNVLVVRQHGMLAGFAIMAYGDEEAHIALLAVHPDHRRRRVGSALLAWLEESARIAGMGLIKLEARAANREAIAFYRAHGFQELELRRGYYMSVENALSMAKDLWLAP